MWNKIECDVEYLRCHCETAVNMKSAILWDVTPCSVFYQVTEPHIPEHTTFLREGIRDGGHL
jgi:hypothetical protein